MRIFHIATVDDWSAARAAGEYRVSSLGKTLEEEGFLHASRREQVAGVFKNFYAGKGLQLLLLTIETDRLASPWREDQVGDTTFPHIYGPLNRGAVVDVTPLTARGGTKSFLQIFFGELMIRAMAALLIMLLAIVGAVVGQHQQSTWGPVLGLVVGLLLGVALVMAYQSRSRASDR